MYLIHQDGRSSFCFFGDGGGWLNKQDYNGEMGPLLFPAVYCIHLFIFLVFIHVRTATDVGERPRRPSETLGRKSLSAEAEPGQE